ncbi:MAG: hypothetical protein FJX11_10720 [Alphaproteobacteria bacterium]|nr:hypothetical protein [Alphaproteobacteria bacterium]
MKPFAPFVVVVGLALAVAGCTSTSSNPLMSNPFGYKPESKEDLLAESGFKTLSLNTPQKVAAFKTLPPHRISQTTFKGRPAWVYPDQNVCGCIYIGGQQAYNTFIKKGRAQMIDSRVNQMNKSDDPYNPTQMNAEIYWDDPWDDSDAYGLYLN